MTSENMFFLYPFLFDIVGFTSHLCGLLSDAPRSTGAESEYGYEESVTGSTAELVRSPSRSRDYGNHHHGNQLRGAAAAPPSETDNDSMSGSVFGSTFELIRTGSRGSGKPRGSVGSRGGIADVSIA